jgi:hypothetical protein
METSIREIALVDGSWGAGSINNMLVIFQIAVDFCQFFVTASTLLSAKTSL